MTLNRKKYVLANWKMNQSLEEIASFFQKLDLTPKNNCQYGISPQQIHGPLVLECARNLPVNLLVWVGTQDCSAHLKGAYTGQVSPKSIEELGLHYTLIGHSERRQYNGETDEILNLKLNTVLNNTKLTAVFCIGETLDQRENGEMETVLKRQLTKGLASIKNINGLVLAYEPVWAIGTGKTASAQQAADAHRFIRKVLTEDLSLDGQKISILYGGSIKPDNFQELLETLEIDGGLVGGASLKASDFNDLCRIIR